MKRKMIAFDYDMTLYDHATWSIPESASRALLKLKQRGNILVLATGRDMDNYYSRDMINSLNMDARIEQNGTKIIAGNELIYDHRMEKNLLGRLLDYGIAKQYCLGVTAGNYDYYTCPDILNDIDIRRFGKCKRNFKPPELIRDMDIRTILFWGNDDQKTDLEEHFPEAKFRRFDVHGADVMEKECSKANGLRLLCRHYDVDISDTFSFGDSMNDMEILETAGTGIAMGNSCAELKEEADYVTTAIGEDGIWNACIHFGLIG